MILRCVVDGQVFEAKRPSAKYCSAKCRQRAHRTGATITALPTSERTEVEGSEGLAASTRRRLEDIGRTDTELGVAALLLASRLDQRIDTGAGMASLMKEYRATLAEAVKDADDDRDALDEIRQSAALKLVRGA